jgi:hypothetical protein
MTAPVANGVPMPPAPAPTEAPKKGTRARGRAPVAPKEKSSADEIIDALKFVNIAQKAKGDTRMTHCCMMASGWLLASDGAIHAGARVAEIGFDAAPHTHKLLDALQKCTGQITFVQMSPAKLIVKGTGKFQASIACAMPDEMFPPVPDPQIAAVNNELKKALGACAAVVNEASPEPHKAGVLLQGGSCVGTDGIALVEYWHGIDLPPNILIPKASAMAIANCQKDATGFGFTSNSVTIWFADGSFIKTQLFEPKFPAYQAIFAGRKFEAWPVPADLFPAIDAVHEFNDAGTVYFGNNIVRSAPLEGEGASHECQGLPGGMSFAAKRLNTVRPYFQKAHWFPAEGKVFFFADNVRGCIMGRTDGSAFDPDQHNSPPTMPTINRQPVSDAKWDNMDDDIPF